jgi:hypothetical protein
MAYLTFHQCLRFGLFRILSISLTFIFIMGECILLRV